MSRIVTASDRALTAIFRQQSDLITRPQALAAGLTKGALRSRLRTDGPWRIVLPGVYLSHNGGLTSAQQEVAATLYAGHGCVLTGMTALEVQGAQVPHSDFVDVLVPAQTQRRSAGFVRMQRTSRMPENPWLIGGIRYAPAARAVADAVRGQTDLSFVRSVVAGAVQQRKCSVRDLAAELQAGPRRGSGALRAALAEVADGIRSVAEGDLRALIKRFGLPDPMYNPQLFVGEAFLAEPDAWWPDAGVAAEMDSRTYHLSPGAWEKDLARDAAMTAQGILVVHVTPARIRSEPAAVARQLWSTYKKGRQRPPLEIRAVPHDRTSRNPA